MLLEIENVTFAHGGSPVLRDFDMAVADGEHRLLIGPSGSGKSTLINLVCGFLSPQHGAIRLGGETISGASERQRDAIRRRFVGIVFQSLRLVSALDVISNVLLAARLAGRPVTRQRALEALARLGIEEKARALPAQLSQGEAQRAAIARAVIARPRLLIADEPTSALDDHNARAVMDLLFEAATAEQVTLLIATHDARLRERIGRTVELTMPMERAA